MRISGGGFFKFKLCELPELDINFGKRNAYSACSFDVSNNLFTFLLASRKVLIRWMTLELGREERETGVEVAEDSTNRRRNFLFSFRSWLISETRLHSVPEIKE